ncbi:phosphatidylserine decarboxylase-domain-containing protein [Cyathus striatus]|nr:phosphatidylserine decarboxylase-domain-containing protein [Cyathus striatus]
MLLAQTMNTNEGFSTYLHSGLNKQFEAMFKPWAAYLSSKDLVIGAALTALSEFYDESSFFDIFEAEDNPETNYGFDSFDAFFNRKFRPGIRPVELPDDPRIINAACESKLYSITTDVQRTSEFWMKGEPYSLQHMLQGNYVDEFVGGTVYQGFLEVTGYHRWHSPVTGIVRKVELVKGCYFVQSPAVINGTFYDAAPPAPGSDLATNPYLRSLGFITSMTARLLIFIESENLDIGLMCFIALGMADISTCTVDDNIKEGEHVTKGQEMGMFHFGGSSHCMVFGPQADIQFFDGYSEPGNHVKVRAAIGGVKGAGVFSSD